MILLHFFLDFHFTANALAVVDDTLIFIKHLMTLCGSLVILGGSLGTSKLDVEGIKALATLPSLDALRGKIIGLLQAPATKVAGVLVAPAGQLARVFGAYGAKEDDAKAA